MMMTSLIALLVWVLGAGIIAAFMIPLKKLDKEFQKDPEVFIRKRLGMPSKPLTLCDNCREEMKQGVYR